MQVLRCTAFCGCRRWHKRITQNYRSRCCLPDSRSPGGQHLSPSAPVPALGLTGITFTGLPSTATQVYAARGVINIGQVKVTLNPANSGFNIPVSVTWSNRTELVTRPAWKGQIGISMTLIRYSQNEAAATPTCMHRVICPSILVVRGLTPPG